MAKFEALTLSEAVSVALAVSKAHSAGVPDDEVEDLCSYLKSVDDVLEHLGEMTRTARKGKDALAKLAGEGTTSDP